VFKQLYHLTDFKLNLLITKFKTFLNVSENPVQNLIKFKNSLPDHEQVVLDLIVEFLYKAEYISPMSGEIMIEYITNSNLETGPSNRFSQRELKELIKTFTNNDHTTNIIIDALQLSGLSGKISLSHSHNDNYVLELLKGYTFEGLSTDINSKSFELKETLVIPIDGYIESVSEIHHLLENLSSSRQTAVLFIRGLSDDVKNTLKVNFDRKTVVCVPVIVPYDIDGVNVLNDIASIAMCDVISSTKGQLISSIDIALYQPVDMLSFYKDSIVVMNRKSSNFVEKHLSFLQEKLTACDLEASKEILKKRIQRLGSRQVNIKVANNEKKFQNSFQIDRCIRAINLSLVHGITSFNGRLYPSSTIQTAKMYSKELLKKLNDIGCIVINE
jgi:hypothetical protein